MKIAELKEILSDIPDDYNILVCNSRDGARSLNVSDVYADDVLEQFTLYEEE